MGTPLSPIPPNPILLNAKCPLFYTDPNETQLESKRIPCKTVKNKANNGPRMLNYSHITCKLPRKKGPRKLIGRLICSHEKDSGQLHCLSFLEVSCPYFNMSLLEICIFSGFRFCGVCWFYIEGIAPLSYLEPTNR